MKGRGQSRIYCNLFTILRIQVTIITFFQCYAVHSKETGTKEKHVQKSVKQDTRTGVNIQVVLIGVLLLYQEKI